MPPRPAARKTYIRDEALFTPAYIMKDAFGFSLKYTLSIEAFIVQAAGKSLEGLAVASLGSFSRRELSPKSDVDVMFIAKDPTAYEREIRDLITLLWDNGIEVSHTVRTPEDISRFLHEDLQTFTQFLEVRFIAGSYEIYQEWVNTLTATLTEDVRIALCDELIEETTHRYKKYGNSPKVIEPNVKATAGGLRDLQLIEWLYAIQHLKLPDRQIELPESEIFINQLQQERITTQKECDRLRSAYKTILTIRHLLHLTHTSKSDRLEFDDQIRIAGLFGYSGDGYRQLMKQYFEASNTIYRFTKSYIKRYKRRSHGSGPEVGYLLDSDYFISGSMIRYEGSGQLSISDIFRGFYYRAKYNAFFSEELRSTIIESLDSFSLSADVESSTFFREILKLNSEVGKTLTIMNELGVLSAFMPEWAEFSGFIQHGVYHVYTADEHTLKTIENLEKLRFDTGPMGRLFGRMKRRDILYLALIFHDIAKPIDISGHEILGAAVAENVMVRLGYSDYETELVKFLVEHHLYMEQVAFRRNLNDPETLNSFTLRVNTPEKLDMLYLLTYADLSAVNPALWTSWKSDMLYELYYKAKAMIDEQLSGEEILIANILPKDISKHSTVISESHVQSHIDALTDEISYTAHFSDEEIARHIEEILEGNDLSVSFNEDENFTNITVISRDSPSLLSKICGVLLINDVNIHDAGIFTRKDGIIIDNFNITDFRTGEKISKDRYQKIEEDLHDVLTGILQLPTEITRMKSRWWRIENRFFKKPGKVKIRFEEKEKFTIIDIYSPDRLGFLYLVTNKLTDLGLNIQFAKISTSGDSIIDAFYVLNQENKKVSKIYYHFIESELTKAIEQIL